MKISLGIINDQDEIYLGRGGWAGAPLTLGVHLTAKWKGFTVFVLGVSRTGAYGMKNNNDTFMDYFTVDVDDKYSEVVRGRWTPPGRPWQSRSSCPPGRPCAICSPGRCSRARRRARRETRKRGSTAMRRGASMRKKHGVSNQLPRFTERNDRPSSSRRTSSRTWR